MARLQQGMDKYKNGIRYRFTVDGKRYTVYGHTAKECREKETKKREQIKEGTYKVSRVTVEEYFDRWMEGKRGTVGESTIRTQRTLFNRIKNAEVDGAKHKIGKLRMAEVETEHVRQMQKSLAADVSSRMTNDCLALLRSMYKTAIAEKVVTWDPTGAVKPLKRTEVEVRDTTHRALTREETARFMKAAEGSYYFSLFRFLLHTGCRVGEAGALRAADIRDGYAYIDKSVTRSETGAHIIGNGTKTAAGKRKVFLTVEASAAYREQMKTNEELFGEISLSDPVFQSPRGTILKCDGVNREIRRICKRCGVDRFTVHAFRDTFITRAIESRMDVPVLMEMVGHRDAQMTLALYAHADAERSKTQMQAVIVS